MTGLLPTFGIVVFAALLPQTASAASAGDGTSNGANGAAQTAAATCTAGAMCAPPNARAVQTRTTPLRDDELPWCINANDPRCSPMHPGDTGKGPLDGDARFSLSAAQIDAFNPAQLPARNQSFTPRAGLHPRHGFSHRVERPPRASERPL